MRLQTCIVCLILMLSTPIATGHELRLIQIKDGGIASDPTCGELRANEHETRTTNVRTYPPNRDLTDIDVYDVTLGGAGCQTEYRVHADNVDPSRARFGILASASDGGLVHGSVFPPFDAEALNIGYRVRRGRHGRRVFREDDSCRVRVRVAGSIETTGLVEGFYLEVRALAGATLDEHIRVESNGGFEGVLLVDPTLERNFDDIPNLEIRTDFEVGNAVTREAGTLRIELEFSIEEVVHDEYCTRDGRVGTWANQGSEAAAVVLLNGARTDPDFPLEVYPNETVFLQATGHTANPTDVPFVLYAWSHIPSATEVTPISSFYGGPHFFAFNPVFLGGAVPDATWNSLGQARAGAHDPPDGSAPCLAPCTVFVANVPPGLRGRSVTFQGIMLDDDSPSGYAITNAAFLRIR